MSSEEDFDRIENNKRKYFFQVRLYEWRAPDVGKYLEMVDAMGEKVLPHTKGPYPTHRERDGTVSASGVPKGLPKCLYNAAWIERESRASPVFYEDLEVSEEAFSLLAASADLVMS